MDIPRGVLDLDWEGKGGEGLGIGGNFRWGKGAGGVFQRTGPPGHMCPVLTCTREGDSRPNNRKSRSGHDHPRVGHSFSVFYSASRKSSRYLSFLGAMNGALSLI